MKKITNGKIFALCLGDFARGLINGIITTYLPDLLTYLFHLVLLLLMGWIRWIGWICHLRCK